MNECKNAYFMLVLLVYLSYGTMLLICFSAH